MPFRAKHLFPGHDVSHAKDLGWQGLSNGRLLAAVADGGFAAFITVDKQIKHEQNLELLPLPVIEIDLPDSRLPAIAAIAPQIIQALSRIERFGFISINQDGRIITAAERAK
jgi:hypothetical protein